VVTDFRFLGGKGDGMAAGAGAGASGGGARSGDEFEHAAPSDDSYGGGSGSHSGPEISDKDISF